MKFRMLLWYMARRMELLARTHPEFIAKLHGRDFVIQISSAEGTHRFFRIRHNRVVSRNSLYATPSITLRFISDDDGFRILTSVDKNVFMTALQAQEVKVEGDYALLMWFMGISRFLRPARGRKPASREMAA